MKPNLFYTLSFLILSSAVVLCGGNPHERARARPIEAAIAGAYEAAPTYQDRGVVRAVRLEIDNAAGRSGDHMIVQEQTAYFETTYRKGGDMRVLVVAMEDDRTGYRSFLKSGTSQKSRSHGMLPFTGARGSFVEGLRQVFLFQGIDGNLVAMKLARDSARPEPNLFSSITSVREVTFNGQPAYEVLGAGTGMNHAVTLWIDSASRMILGAERISVLGVRHKLVVTTLYKPEPNVSLPAESFAERDAEEMLFNPGEWDFPPLHAGELRRKVEAAREHSFTPPPPSFLTERPERFASPSPREDAPVVTAAEPQAAPAPLVQHLSSEEMAAVVLIEGEKGQGTGFITRINDISFVITNLHVLADAKNVRIRTSRGETLPVRSIHGARRHDVALIRIDDMPGGLVMATSTADSRIGDEVVVVGNRLGGGVLTQERGKILGIGPERIEVDAKFQPGNSGSPIINTRTGEVIGIATYLQEVSIMGGQRAVDSSGRPSREVTTRWFGYRFDSITEWERIDWAEWQRQQAVVQAYRENSDVLLGLLRGERDVYMSNPSFRRIVERFERQIGSSRLSNDDYARRAREFVRDMINFSVSDTRSLDGHFYDYFRSSDYFETSIPLQLQFRSQLTQYLEDLERDFRHLRQTMGR